MPQRAAIFIQRGAPEDKQYRVCLDYCDDQHWVSRHVVQHWSRDAAVSLVRDGAVDVVVAAFPSKAVSLLAEEVGDLGQVVYVHPEPTVVRPARKLPSIGDLVRRLRIRGETTQEIAGFLDVDPEAIRRISRGGSA